MFDSGIICSRHFLTVELFAVGYFSSQLSLHLTFTSFIIMSHFEIEQDEDVYWFLYDRVLVYVLKWNDEIFVDKYLYKRSSHPKHQFESEIDNFIQNWLNQENRRRYGRSIINC